LDLHAPISGDPKFWIHALPSGNDNWDYNDRPTSPGNAKDYFDTLEHNLNTAVYYSAAAINLLIGYYIGKNCARTDDDYDPRPPYGGGTGVKGRVGQYMALFLWQFLGLFSTLIAISIVKQVKIFQFMVA
jgi:hypothetical protein